MADVAVSRCYSTCILLLNFRHRYGSVGCDVLYPISRNRHKEDTTSAIMETNPFSKGNYYRGKKPVAAASASDSWYAEKNLRALSLADLLLKDLTLAQLMSMSPGQLFALIVSGGMASLIATAVTDALRPDQPRPETDLALAPSKTTTRNKFRTSLGDLVPECHSCWRGEFQLAMDDGMHSAGLAYRDYPHRASLEAYLDWDRQFCLLQTPSTEEVGFTSKETDLLAVLKNACVRSCRGRRAAPGGRLGQRKVQVRGVDAGGLQSPCNQSEVGGRRAAVLRGDDGRDQQAEPGRL